MGDRSHSQVRELDRLTGSGLTNNEWQEDQNSSNRHDRLDQAAEALDFVKECVVCWVSKKAHVLCRVGTCVYPKCMQHPSRGLIANVLCASWLAKGSWKSSSNLEDGNRKGVGIVHELIYGRIDINTVNHCLVSCGLPKYPHVTKPCFRMDFICSPNNLVSTIK